MIVIMIIVVIVIVNMVFILILNVRFGFCWQLFRMILLNIFILFRWMLTGFNWSYCRTFYFQCAVFVLVQLNNPLDHMLFILWFFFIFRLILLFAFFCLLGFFNSVCLGPWAFHLYLFHLFWLLDRLDFIHRGHWFERWFCWFAFVLL